LDTELPQTKDEQQVKEFLWSNKLKSRIKFYWEATYLYILSRGYDEGIYALIVEHLIKDGFTKEAERLKSSGR